MAGWTEKGKLDNLIIKLEIGMWFTKEIFQTTTRMVLEFNTSTAIDTRDNSRTDADTEKED
jgi:hypothetical protein